MCKVPSNIPWSKARIEPWSFVCRVFEWLHTLVNLYCFYSVWKVLKTHCKINVLGKTPTSYNHIEAIFVVHAFAIKISANQ